MPSVVRREASALTSPRAPSLSSRLSDASRSSPAPPSLRQVVQPPRTMRAVEEAFRVNPTPDRSAWRPSHHIVRRRDGPDNEDYAYDEVVLIHTLADNVVGDIRENLARPGFRARLPHRTETQSQPRGGSGMYVYSGNDVQGEEREDDHMDIDEPETDCISRAPSRSSSPPPSLRLPLQPSPSPSRSITHSRYSNTRHSSRPGRRTITRDGVTTEQVVPNSDLDIAGTCFDPSGGFIYVATTDSVSEWAVRGGEKRWWGCNAWA